MPGTLAYGRARGDRSRPSCEELRHDEVPTPSHVRSAARTIPFLIAVWIASVPAVAAPADGPPEPPADAGAAPADPARTPTPGAILAAPLPPPSPPPLVGLPTPVAPAVEPKRDVFEFETLIQVRDQQTWAYVRPALEARVRQELGAAADETLRLIRDTARAHDGFQLRWASFRFEARPRPYVRAGMEIDFARLLDSEDLARLIWEAPVVLTPRPWIDITTGVLHVPFSVLELVETSQLELGERGPAHEMLEEQLSLSRRNTGVRVDVSPIADHRRLQLTAGAFQGATTGATGAQDFRGPGLLAGRVLGEPIDNLRLGASVAWRPRATLEWWDELRYRYVVFEPGVAIAANATLSLSRFLFRGEWMMGSRTDADVPVPLQFRRGDARNFMAGWGMIAIRLPVRTMTLMPALRAEWLDVDTRIGFHERTTASIAAGRVLHLTAALTLDVDAHTRLLLDVSFHDVEPGTRHGEYREIVRYDTDWTSIILQLQFRA
jgi:hypothetical protein